MTYLAGVLDAPFKVPLELLVVTEAGDVVGIALAI